MRDLVAVQVAFLGDRFGAWGEVGLEDLGRSDGGTRRGCKE